LTGYASRSTIDHVKNSLILIPGLLCDATVWQSQAEALADVAEVRIAIHGSRDSLGALAETIIARAPPRFAIAGHSMGGRIALEILRRVPERICGVALLDSGYEPLSKGESGQREVAGRHALLAMARREGMRAMARKWIQDMVHPARLSDEDLIGVILDMFERRTPELFEMQIRALLDRPDASAVLSAITCPALLLCGREDTWAPPSRHVDMSAMIPKSAVAIIPECGHMATLERPKAVTTALRRWLGRVR
jgi:pimeloyl-ACP methyl ester carboxylesterase